MNPVLEREMRERFRTRRAAPLFTLWVLGVGLVGYLMYLVAGEIVRSGFGIGPAIAGAFVGRFLFETMALIMLTAVILVVPGLTATSVVAERERQTLHLLQVTQLSARQLVVGKLGSSLAYLGLLVVSVMPVLAIPLLFGGMGFGDVAAAVGMILLVALMLGSVSIWVSSRARSSRGAVAGSYLWAIGIGMLSFLLLLGEFVLFHLDDPEGGRDGTEYVSTWVNPYFGLVSAIEAPLSRRLEVPFPTPFTPFDALLFVRQGQTEMFGAVVDAPLADLPDGRPRFPTRRPPVWVYTVAIYLAVIAVTLRAATRQLRAPIPTIREPRRSRAPS